MNSYFSWTPLLIFSGIVLMGMGVFAFLHQRQRINRSRRAIGVVTELVRQRKSGEYVVQKTADGHKIQPKYLYRPVIRFRTENGRTVTFTTSIARSPAPYQVGDQVEIIYDPATPKKAQINRRSYLWFHVAMLFGFGLLTLLMGVLGLVFAG